MAKDAIGAVRKVEEEAREILQQAKDTANKMRMESETLAEEKYNQILLDAEAKAKKLKATAVEEGEILARPIIEEGIREAETLLGMDEKDLQVAVNIIIERIVNTNGNS